jgi:peptidoglycan/LPS O-acetylase OafA/YrhL
VVVPPQIYLHRVAATGEPFGAFYGHFVDHMRTPAGIDWQHLWFIAYLIVAELVALPLFVWWGSRRASAVRRGSRGLAATAGLVVLPLAALLSAAVVTARGLLPATALFGAVVPRDFLPYLVAYVAGFVLAGSPGAWDALGRHRRSLLAAAVVTAAALFALRWGPMFVPRATDELRAAVPYWAPVNSWCWVAAALGHARHHLRFENAFLRYARVASYPVYILHQAVIVVLGAHVIGWNAGAPLKFVVITAATAFLVLATYELAVAPVRRGPLRLRAQAGPRRGGRRGRGGGGARGRAGRRGPARADGLTPVAARG